MEEQIIQAFTCVCILINEMSFVCLHPLIHCHIPTYNCYYEFHIINACMIIILVIVKTNARLSHA